MKSLQFPLCLVAPLVVSLTGFACDSAMAQPLTSKQIALAELRQTRVERTSSQIVSEQFPSPHLYVLTLPSLSNSSTTALLLGQISGGLIVVSLFLIGSIVVIVAVAVVILPKGMVRIGENEVGIVIKKVNLNPSRQSLKGNRLVALNGEIGPQADTLSPGLHWGYWFWMYDIRREPIIRISPDEIGLVEAQDGSLPPHGQQFGQIVECDNFQDARKFLENQGQIGQQLAILRAGAYRINTYLFRVRKGRVIDISPDEVGLVEAKAGAPLSSGQQFGRVVECNNFQDAQAFLMHGQRGKQLSVLTTGRYWINTDLFGVRKTQAIHISPDEVGLVEAKDGASPLSGKQFGRIVECNNFQDAKTFIQSGGQRGKQLAILTAGTYQINTELFNVRKERVIHISPDEIGLVEAKDGGSPPLGQQFGQMVECDNFQDAQAFLEKGGNKGKQLAILTAGVYQINTDLFSVRKEPITIIPPGEIGLVVANDGAPIPTGRILARVVECNDFQDAHAFLQNGGQRGKQLAILKTGRYQINTDLFRVITTANIRQQNEVQLKDLQCYKVASDRVGIVSTHDGAPLQANEIACPYVDGHNKFQDGQKFIDAGGYRGLQEEVLLEGSYNLNPWFVEVEQIPLITIETGTVGVIISRIGKDPIIESEDSSSKSEYKLVERGYKGVEKEPYGPGKYPINTRVKSIEIVPTHEISLEWSDKTKPMTNYDANLKTLNLRSQDGFPFKIEVTQVISIDAKDAPKMISRVGSLESEEAHTSANSTSNRVRHRSIRNLVTRVLSSMIDNYFRNSAQNYEAIDFLKNRKELQSEAISHITTALTGYGVRSIGTFINEIDLPEEIENPLRKGKEAEIIIEQLRKEISAEKQRRELAEAKAETDNQRHLTQAKQAVEIAKLDAEARIERGQADAQLRELMNKVDLDRLRGQMQLDSDMMKLARQLDLDALLKQIEALGDEGYRQLESNKAWADAFGKFRGNLVPNTIIGGSGSAGGADVLQTGPMQLMFVQLLQQLAGEQRPIGQQGNTIQSQLPAEKSSVVIEPKTFASSSSTETRLPIVLLLDTSSAVSGEYIDKLSEGINTFVREIRGDAIASRRVEVAVIFFDTFARVVQSFTTVDKLSQLDFSASGTPAMGQGINLSLTEIEQRITTYRNTSTQYYKPWMFLVTGGTSSDSCRKASDQINRAVDNYGLNFFAVGVQGVDLDTLVQITPSNIKPLMLDGLKFQELFYWLADSMKRIANSEIGGRVDLDLPLIASWARR